MNNLESKLCNGFSGEGVLSFPGTLYVDGYFEGELRCEGLVVVGETATVKGRIRCGELLLNGVVEGVVRSSGLAKIASGGVLSGNLYCGSIAIQRNAKIDGLVSTLSSGKVDELFEDPRCVQDSLSQE